MLTVIAAKNAPPKGKDYKLADSGGLYLFVTTKGFKSWRCKYRFGSKEKRLILGSFPKMTLAEARDARDAARSLLDQGKDPALVKQRQRLLRSTPSQLTFERFARDWHGLKKPRWKEVHANDVLRSLERDVFPSLGAHDVGEIDEDMVHAVLVSVEERGAIETAHRLRQRISQVFKYAKVKAKGSVSGNPAADLAIVMQVVPKSKRRPALLLLPQLHQLTRTVEQAGASPITKCASRFLSLTVQRPGMVRHMLWENLEGIDWEDPEADASEALWRVPAAVMKQEFDLREDEAFEHVVPLAPQAVDVLRTVRQLTSNSIYVFPSARSFREPMSENAIGYLYNREGYKGRHCPHGWRSSFSTIMNEAIALLLRTDEAEAFNRLVIDLMLAHLPKGVSETERIYNRAAYMDRRREIANEWADLLLAGMDEAASLMDGPRRRYKE